MQHYTRTTIKDATETLTHLGAAQILYLSSSQDGVCFPNAHSKQKDPCLRNIPETDDRDIFRKINKDIEGIIVADAGYVSKELEKDMNVDGVRWCLIRPRKRMKKLALAWQMKLYALRFRIEFDFRSLKMSHGLVSSLPRSLNGMVGNYLSALLSFTLA